MGNDLLQTCYQKSLDLLRANATPAGILASSRTKKAVGRHYASIFGRDASICALGMVASGEPDLIESARLGLLTLAHCQAANGQIPKYVKPDSGEVDFWYTGCIDATLWWLIALSFMDQSGADERLSRKLAPQAALAIKWLECQEHQKWYLLQQNEASDWADIMPRSGFVLYSNVLWHWVKRLYDLPNTSETRDYARLLFWPYGNVVPEERRARLLMHYIRQRSRQTPFYLSFVNFAAWGEEIDIFGNLLAALTGLAAISTAGKLVLAMQALQAHRPYPLRVTGSPIRQDARLWRLYMQRHRQNLPWQYHNGGSWPFVGGFWVMLLARLGREKEALTELEYLARANQVNNWEFNEWFHGQSGKAMGMPGQSWNAALFILAYRTVFN
ncbi:MAG TPA: glycoside hydrolase 100 family protein [Desulfuromonadaceae bacterium]|jgi:glycogen debranching enzyme